MERSSFLHGEPVLLLYLHRCPAYFCQSSSFVCWQRDLLLWHIASEQMFWWHPNWVPRHFRKWQSLLGSWWPLLLYWLLAVDSFAVGEIKALYKRCFLKGNKGKVVQHKNSLELPTCWSPFLFPPHPNFSMSGQSATGHLVWCCLRLWLFWNESIVV